MSSELSPTGDEKYRIKAISLFAVNQPVSIGVRRNSFNSSVSPSKKPPLAVKFGDQDMKARLIRPYRAESPAMKASRRNNSSESRNGRDMKMKNSYVKRNINSMKFDKDADKRFKSPQNKSPNERTDFRFYWKYNGNAQSK